MASMTLEDLVSQLRKAYGEDLRSIVLYGSAVAGEPLRKKASYNVLVIVNSFSLIQCRAASAVARSWHDAGHPAPMTFTQEEWRSSADIFPMEYADILERNRVLYGDPPFDGITVQRSDLRLQVEHETVGKLLHVRQGAILAGSNEKRQRELLEGTLSSLMVVFRSIVRLHGEVPPTDYEALSGKVAQLTGLLADPFIAVVRHMRGAERLSRERVARVLEGYLTGIERLATHLDRFSR